MWYIWSLYITDYISKYDELHSSIAQSVCQRTFSLLEIRFQRPFWVQILYSAEEDNLSPFDSKIACLCESIETNNIKQLYNPLGYLPFLPMSWGSISLYGKPFFCLWWLSNKQLETHECILSTVATDHALLQYQAISIHSADQISIALDNL